MKKSKSNRRTINDITVEECGLLAEAAIELLNMARFLAWMQVAEKDEDTSIIDCLNRMADVLERIGLPQGTNEEYFARLKKILTTPPTKEVWAKHKGKTSLPEILA
jgi:hypothetical protein